MGTHPQRERCSCSSLCWVLGCDHSSWQGCLGTRLCHRLHCIGVQVLEDAHITLHGGVEGSLMDATGLQAQEGGLEDHHLWTLESLIDDGDHPPIRQLLTLLQRGRGCSSNHFLL